MEGDERGRFSLWLVERILILATHSQINRNQFDSSRDSEMFILDDITF